MIPQLIFDWARRTPDKTALIYNGRRVTYSKLAGFIALALRQFTEHGYTGPGFAILAVRNLMETWILGLALRSLGLDTVAVWSASAVKEIDLPNVRCVVTSSLEAWPSLDNACQARGYERVSVALKDEGTPEIDGSAAKTSTGGHVLLTSGTTGRSKMVLVTPEQDAAFLPEIVENLGLDRDSAFCVFNYAPWTGIGYKWAASAWVRGGTTIIGQSNAPHRALLRPEMTHAVLSAPMLDRLLATPERAFSRNDALLLAVGAGAITRSQLDEARRRITSRVVNVLASTEGGLIGATPLNDPDDLRSHRLVPGRIVEIVDDQDRPALAGETGRVRIATVGGLTGYLRDDAASAECFKDGYFYPGDLAMMRTDGRLVLQGRVNDVVHLGGSKFAPETFEHRFRTMLGVAVCLFSWPGDDGEDLHLAVESAAPERLQHAAARIAKEMPAFARMRIHCVPQFPRNALGKIMRAEIRARLMTEENPDRAI